MKNTDPKKFEEVSQILSLLSHPKRLTILCILKDGEQSVKEIQEGCHISQSQTSQFLKQLSEGGYISSRRDGTFIYYRISDTKIISLLHLLSTLYCPDLLSS